MTQRLICLFFVLISPTLNAQDQYIDYYNLVNKANEHWHHKDPKLALAAYQEGFRKVDYVHSFNYAKAARLTASLKKYQLTETYIVEAIKRGFPSDFIYQKAFNKFRKTAVFKSLEKQIHQYQQEHESTINLVYKHKIDSLHFIDQHQLRGNLKVKGFDLDTTLAYSDDSNFNYLLELIDQYGFPSEQTIGYKGYRKAWVIIHHNARLPKNHVYHSMLLEALKKGAYQPENYCWVIDQGQELKGAPLIYFHWDVAKDVEDLTKAEKLEIDARREKVGMPSINRIKVVKKKKRKRNQLKW